MSSGGGNTTSTTKVQYSPAEQAARDSIAQGAQKAFETSSKGPYPGAKPIGPSADTQAGLQAGDLAARQMGVGAQAAAGANDQLLHATDVNNNPALQSAMDAATRPMIDQFQEAGGALSQIRNGAMSNGSYGSSRQGIAEGLAQKALQQQVGDIRSTMMSKAYTDGLQAQGDAVKNQAMVNMMMQMPSQQLLANGATTEGYQQNAENYNAAARDFDQNSQWQPLQNFANIVYGGSNGETQTTQSAPKSNTAGQLIGTAGSLAMMYMMM